MKQYTVLTHRERPDLKAKVLQVYRETWSSIGRNPVAKRWSAALFEDFAEYQCMLCDTRDTVLAAGSTLPIAWDGSRERLPKGWDGALEQGFTDLASRQPPNTLVALSITITPACDGQGLGTEMLQVFKDLATAQGFHDLIAPVRPSLKERYPLTPMERYVDWRRDDGLPLDPWLRIHEKSGGRFLAIAPASYVTSGTVQEWEQWTGLRFPESGEYVIPNALEPLVVDCEQDHGRYEETNVWMRYRFPPD